MSKIVITRIFSNNRIPDQLLQQLSQFANHIEEEEYQDAEKQIEDATTEGDNLRISGRKVNYFGKNQLIKAIQSFKQVIVEYDENIRLEFSKQENMISINRIGPKSRYNPNDPTSAVIGLEAFIKKSKSYSERRAWDFTMRIISEAHENKNRSRFQSSVY